MTKHFFTFGFGQEHVGGYHVIEAETPGDARKKMYRRFGMKWAFQYDSAKAAGVHKFHLHEVLFEEPTP